MRLRRGMTLAFALAAACTSPARMATPAHTQGTAPVAALATDAGDTSPETSTSAVVDASAARETDAASTADDARVRALLASRFASAPGAGALADDLYTRLGDIVETAPLTHMNGGWRGPLRMAPQLPTGRYEPHLRWIRDARVEHDAFLTQVAREAAEPVHYRWRALTLQFFRSIGGHRPSAYAEGWSIAYNLEGSLNLDAKAVGETMFHELFHLNDEAHDDWSTKALRGPYDAIVARCGTRVECLAPFAPNDTRVRGGTYYAFQPNNGDPVREYAAELAVRYSKEERPILAGGAPPKPPFKCGPDPNPRVWKLFVDEFFGGFDRVPACP